MEKVVIKLLENPLYPQLSMKYVGAVEYATPKTGEDGKTITGFDENALTILRIEDPKVRKDTQTKIKKEREELERLLGQDLSSNSSFWDTFFIALSDEETILDLSNPMDRLKEKYLVANRYVAPSKEAISDDDDYYNCIFYLYREEEEVSKKSEKMEAEDRTKGKLVSLKEENPGRLKVIASFIFGHTFGKEMSPEAAYVKLREYIFDETDAVERRKKVNAFLAATEKTTEELQVKIILDKAIKKRFIVQRNNIFRRDDIIIGNSYDEALEYLGSVENSAELRSLSKQLD